MPQSFVQPISGRGPCRVMELPTKSTRGPFPDGSNAVLSRAFCPNAGTGFAWKSVCPPAAAHLLARANRFIAQNATRGISARDVATHLGVSRRLADLRFQQFSGETINETIIRCRLDAVKKLLATTNRPIKLVSTACGYADLAYLKTLFKRRFGLTMRAYRAQHSSRAT